MDKLDAKPTVLIVDDSTLNIRIVDDVLMECYSVKTAASGEEALLLATTYPIPDLILLDIVMPDMDGYEVCKRLKNSEDTRDIPVVFLTSMSEAQNEEYGLSLGAIDYITKPFHPSILKARVKNHLELKYLRDRLAQISLIDGLTGIPNRRRFDETLTMEWKRSFRSGKPLSLIMIDIDHFKNYNDSYGHMAGDACLVEVASQLTKTLKRPGDLVSRWGGEEFACILPETDSAGAMLVAEELRKAIAYLDIPHESSPIAPILTISLGIATMIPRPGDKAEELNRRADEALYTAKRAGRNRIVQRLTARNPSIRDRQKAPARK